jgi:uncharacterized membrane protein YdjX (TVP38/TMEM64 family)
MIPARLRLALLAAGVLVLFGVFGLGGVVSRADVRSLVDGAGDWGAPLGALLVPGPLLAAVSGALFGTLTGFVVTVTSAVLSAVLAFGVGRQVGRDGARELGGARFAAVDAWVQRRGLWAVIVQRLLPGVPDAPVNYAAGLLRLRLRDLALGTAIGVAPRALAYTALGDSFDDLGSPTAIAAIALLGATAILGLVVGRRALRRP